MEGKKQINEVSEFLFIEKESIVVNKYTGRTVQPLYISNKGKEYFVTSRVVGGDILEQAESEREIEDIKLQLEKNKYMYFCQYCRREDIFEFLEWVVEKKFTLEIYTELFLEDERNFVDFHGNLCEYSCAFRFRIYNKALLRKVKRTVSSINQILA